MNTSRRTFLKTLALVTLGGLSAGIYVNQVEPNWLSIERLTLKLPGLPPAFEGYTIAQISDLHLGPFIGSDKARAAVAATNDLQPDITVFTGDFVSRVSRGEPDILQTELAALTARDGVFATFGNHDWWTNHRVVKQAVQKANFTILDNLNLALKRGGDTLYLAGVDDIWDGQADLNKALRNIPTGATVILLAHEPDYADTVAADGRVSLQLSGHSHGGQVNIPGLPLQLPYYARKYPVGLNRVGAMQVYTNRGLGMTNVPVRLNCRPEITLFTLSAG